MANLLDDLLSDESGPEDNENTFEEEDKKLAPLLPEIDLIMDQGVRFFVRSVLLKAESFWTVPASFSGMFHPPDERGEHGNVLHTKRVVRIVELMCVSYDRNSDEADMLIAAALLHDLTKGGPFGAEYDPMHPYTVDKFVEMCIREDEKYADNTNRSTTLFMDDESIAQILRLIRCHLGLWSPIPETYPISTLDWILHLADHLASKLHFIVDGPNYDVRRWMLDEQPEIS